MCIWFGLHRKHAKFISVIKYVDAVVVDVPFCVRTVIPYYKVHTTKNPSYKARFHLHWDCKILLNWSPQERACCIPLVRRNIHCWRMTEYSVRILSFRIIQISLYYILGYPNNDIWTFLLWWHFVIAEGRAL